mmetsp:Transcript_18461/g.39486  ORF Transcript_18461/g.39486 Transcript_18461/m.39486 type:complete len:135 (-) Transcript_18461:807-1211(-)
MARVQSDSNCKQQQQQQQLSLSQQQSYRSNQSHPPRSASPSGSDFQMPTRSQPQPSRRAGREGNSGMKKWRSQDFLSQSLSSLKASQRYILPQGAPKFPDAPKPPGWEQPILPGMMARVPSTEDASDLLNSTAS